MRNQKSLLMLLQMLLIMLIVEHLMLKLVKTMLKGELMMELLATRQWILRMILQRKLTRTQNL